jgi:hypothetical protein
MNDLFVNVAVWEGWYLESHLVRRGRGELVVARVVRREDVRAKTLDAWDHLNHVARNETTRYGFHYCLE